MGTFLANAKGVIIFTDLIGWPTAAAFGELVEQTGIQMEMHLVSNVQASFFAEPSDSVHDTVLWYRDVGDEDALLSKYLEAQEMGTRLFTCGDATTVKRLQRIAQNAGFGAEEAYFEVIGKQRDRVFCAACSHLNPPSQKKFIRCTNCGRLLEVSSHYSKRLDAVLGYLTVPRQTQDSRGEHP